MFIEESKARAGLILDGNHPWITFQDVADYYGLDTSFVWTEETFAPYVEAYIEAPHD